MPEILSANSSGSFTRAFSICNETPVTVAVAYAIKYDREAILASNASLLATVLSVAAVVFWIVLGSVILKVL